MTDTSEELRIIAKDTRGLSVADRETLRSAADEHDRMHRLLLSTQDALIESWARRIALNERLLVGKRSFTTGPVEVGFRFLPMTHVHWNTP